MSKPSLRNSVSFPVLALLITSFPCAAQNTSAVNVTAPAGFLSSFKQIGKVTPRSAKEIESSDWSIGCETLDRDLADYSKYKSYLGPLGAKSARLQGGWAKTEKQHGVYDWKWLDDIIDDMISQGVQPWVELSYGNPIYAGGGGPTLGDTIPRSEEALKAWDAWAKAMVERYKNRITTWEVWNEPDVGKATSPEDYAAFYIRTAEIIRAIQPGAKLYALGLAGRANYVDVLLQTLSAQGKLGLVDVITFHGYPEVPEKPGDYTTIKEMVEKSGAKIQLLMGETGAPSSKTTGALSKFAWTEMLQVKWDLRRMLTYRSISMPMNLFTLSEFIYNDAHRKGLNTKGLLAINPDKSISHVKPSYYAAQNVFSIFDSTLVRDEDVTGTAGTDKPVSIDGYRKKPSGNSVVAIWFNSEAAAESNDYTPVDFTFRNVHFKEPVYVDLRTGGVFEIPAGSWSQEGGETKFRAIPVYDSPILIADKPAFLFK